MQASGPEGDRDQVAIICDTVAELVRKGTDLTTRQFAVLLTCYLHDRAYTVRGLAAELHIPTPAITRTLDRLAVEELIRRKTDPRDRRSVLIERTRTGTAFLREVRRITMAAARKQGQSR